MDHSTPGFPVLHHLLEFAQIRVHWVNDAIQPSHPRQPPFPFAFNLSHLQGFFQWVSSIHQVKYWSFNPSIHPSNENSGFIPFRIDWSSCYPRDSQESCLAQQLENINSLALGLLDGSIPSPNIMTFWSGDLWKVIRLQEQNPCEWNHCPSKRRPQRVLLRASVVWGYRRKTTIYELRSGPSSDTEHAGTLLLTYLDSQTERNVFIS